MQLFVGGARRYFLCVKAGNMAVNGCEWANLTNATTRIPIETADYILTVKIVVGTTCLLSILGASLIILTYVAFRDLRTIARQLLVNLSVADIVIAASHFVGLLTNYERFLYSNLRSDVDVWCSVQGAVTMYGTISSFLWTIAVALYMFTVIVMKRPEIAKKMVPVYYLVCWGVPIVFPVWFGIKRYLGFELPADVGMLSDHHCHARLTMYCGLGHRGRDNWSHPFQFVDPLFYHFFCLSGYVGRNPYLCYKSHENEGREFEGVLMNSFSRPKKIQNV